MKNKMKRFLSGFIAAIMIFAALPGALVGVAADDDVITIATYEQLVAWGQDGSDCSGKTVRLTADIVANAIPSVGVEAADKSAWNQWTAKSWFLGTFDGMGHSITGLYVNGGDYASFIKNLAGVVKNVYFKDVYVSGGATVGAVVGASVGFSVDFSITTPFSALSFSAFIVFSSTIPFWGISMPWLAAQAWNASTACLVATS